ncbi:DNA ligase 4-like [Cydia splendana]|uniref:DNA ligase 4-like n=1 Tax=Cydia splendana TaxID=1100963 RepID=UPI00300CC3E8
MCHRYDRFGDSYVDATDEETLRRCFMKVDQPLHLLTASRSTNMCHRYDRFGDSYVDATDEETLRRCFMKVDEEPEVHLTRTEMLQLDRVLFGDQHPFSFLRNCALHFPTPTTNTIVARMYGASIVEPHNATLTHVVLPRGSDKTDVTRAERIGRGLVVSEDWLDACVEEREYVNEKPFLFNSIDLYVP